MNARQLLYGGAAIIGIAVAFSLAGGSLTIDNTTSGDGATMVVYKSPDCGCCDAWARYADQAGYDVEVRNVDDMAAVKDEHDVPHDVWSCHTATVDGYVVEGHIPVEAVETLLAEEPELAGIGMPGMPSGSPGMPGPKQGEWTIRGIHEDGSLTEFMRM